jgi:hypothetical protein
MILIHIYRKFQKEKANNARLQAEVEDSITMFTLLQKDEAHLKRYAILPVPMIRPF